jgi:hypothetical protein
VQIRQSEAPHSHHHWQVKRRPPLRIRINTITKLASHKQTRYIQPPLGDDGQETTLNPHFTSVAWKYFKRVTVPKIHSPIYLDQILPMRRNFRQLRMTLHGIGATHGFHNLHGKAYLYHEDPLSWWAEEGQKNYPRLAIMARDYFAIQGKEIILAASFHR